MAENEPQESCITTIQKWCIDFYKAPCFWLKIIPLLIVIGLAALGLFQIVTSVFHYFREPLSYFDPERLGQLGDFLGGTLNPIFGFATVCLLVWSVFIQRKELSLTRRELKKSARALKKQVELATDDYNRKQLATLLNNLEQQYLTLIMQKIPLMYVIRREENGVARQLADPKNIKELFEALQRYNSATAVPSISDVRSGGLDDKTKAIFDEIENQINDILKITYETKKLTKSKAVKIHFQKVEEQYRKILFLLNLETKA